MESQKAGHDWVTSSQVLKFMLQYGDSKRLYYVCVIIPILPVGEQNWASLITLLACAAAAAKSLQSCPTLCVPIDGNPPGSAVPGILQARTLEWVAISFSNAWKWKVKVKSLSRVQLLATPWTAAYQAPLSMGFSRQEYWSGVPLLTFNRLQKDSLTSEHNTISFK